MTNTQKIADFIYHSSSIKIPEEVLNYGRLCLADWMSVSIGALTEDAARVVYDTTKENHQRGKSNLLLGGVADALTAALCNGTLAHCLDFDDTHIKSNTHTSAPLWAATLALGQEIDSTQEDILRAFIIGFEVSTRVGYGVGEIITEKGWHCTGIFGAIGSAAAACVLYKLDQAQIINALSTAATQAGGLTISFGTMAKPFHAGKAAFNGLLGAKLAKNGFVAQQDIFAIDGGFISALVQDKTAELTPVHFDEWELLNNSFKPYAACHLVHPAVDCVKKMLTQIHVHQIQQLRFEVGELTMQVTGNKSGKPQTPLAAKFDIRYCIALALKGADLMVKDFSEEAIQNLVTMNLTELVSVKASQEMGYTSAKLHCELKNGSIEIFEVTISKGHPGNPISWDDMKIKFNHLVDDQNLWGQIQFFGEKTPFALLSFFK
jgi:2-methylcitrate dehydratase PrpD